MTRVTFFPLFTFSFLSSFLLVHRLSGRIEGLAGWQRMVAVSLCITGDSINKPGLQRCALPCCSPTGILCPSRVVFCRRHQQREKLRASPRACLGVI